MAKFNSKTKIRSDYPDNWTNKSNNILGDRQLGVSWTKNLTEHPTLKQGDGVHPYDELPPFDSPITLDRYVTEKSRNGVKSIGIWSILFKEYPYKLTYDYLTRTSSLKAQVFKTKDAILPLTYAGFPIENFEISNVSGSDENVLLENLCFLQSPFYYKDKPQGINLTLSYSHKNTEDISIKLPHFIKNFSLSDNKDYPQDKDCLSDVFEIEEGNTPLIVGNLNLEFPRKSYNKVDIRLPSNTKGFYGWIDGTISFESETQTSIPQWSITLDIEPTYNTDTFDTIDTKTFELTKQAIDPYVANIRIYYKDSFIYEGGDRTFTLSHPMGDYPGNDNYVVSINNRNTYGYTVNGSRFELDSGVSLAIGDTIIVLCIVKDTEIKYTYSYNTNRVTIDETEKIPEGALVDISYYYKTTDLGYMRYYNRSALPWWYSRQESTLPYDVYFDKYNNSITGYKYINVSDFINETATEQYLLLKGNDILYLKQIAKFTARYTPVSTSEPFEYNLIDYVQVGNRVLDVDEYVVRESSILFNNSYDTDVTVIVKYHTWITAYTFFNMSAKEIVLSKNTTRIGAYALASMSLESVKNLENVEVVEEYAFGGCFVEDYFFNKLKHIKKGAFQMNISLKSITFGGFLETIDENAFFGCLSLESVYSSKPKDEIDIDPNGNSALLNADWYTI